MRGSSWEKSKFPLGSEITDELFIYRINSASHCTNLRVANSPADVRVAVISSASGLTCKSAR